MASHMGQTVFPLLGTWVLVIGDCVYHFFPFFKFPFFCSVSPLPVPSFPDLIFLRTSVLCYTFTFRVTWIYFPLLRTGRADATRNSSSDTSTPTRVKEETLFARFFAMYDPSCDKSLRYNRACSNIFLRHELESKVVTSSCLKPWPIFSRNDRANW